MSFFFDIFASIHVYKKKKKKLLNKNIQEFSLELFLTVKEQIVLLSTVLSFESDFNKRF